MSQELTPYTPPYTPRELTDAGENVQARYDYDPFGRQTQLSGTMTADFGYTGDYYHATSGLCLTLNREYSAGLGRWISRDPSGERGGINLYGYVGNAPIDEVDPFGLSWWNPFSWFGRGGLPPFQPINNSARDALSKFFKSGDPNDLNGVPNDQLEKARDNAGRACKKYSQQGRDDQFSDEQARRQKMLDDELNRRTNPGDDSPPWLAPLLGLPEEIFSPLFFPPDLGTPQRRPNVA